MYLRRDIACLALSLLLGCAGRPRAPEPGPDTLAPQVEAPVVAPFVEAAPAAQAPVEPAREDDDIIEAVLRHEWARFAGGGVKYAFIFIRFPNQQDNPPPEFMARFEGHEPRVLPACFADPGMNGVRHWYGEKGRGIILRVTELRRVGLDRAEVEGGHHAGGRSSSRRTYSVERREGRWVVVGDKMWFAS